MKTILFGYLFALVILVCNFECTEGKSSVQPLSPKKVICYFTNWAVHREEPAKFTPDNIDSDLCTHIVYAYASLDPESLIIKPTNPKMDIENKFYQYVTDLRHKGVKNLIAVGGFSDTPGNKYDRLLTNVNARRNFIKSVVKFLQEHNFDGLNLEYPMLGRKDPELRAKVRDGFAQMVSELSAHLAFKKNGWLLTATASADTVSLDAGYEVPQLKFDWISIMPYNYHGNLNGENGPTPSSDNLNVESTVNYWIKRGIPPQNLILGISSAGQLYKLDDPKHHGRNAKKSLSTSLGAAGSLSNTPGSLAFYEICRNAKQDKWIVKRDSDPLVHSYSYYDNQWVSFDDAENVRAKAKLIREKDLGGGMLWTMDMDDFTGICGCGNFPLLTTLNQELSRTAGKPIKNCTPTKFSLFKN